MCEVRGVRCEVRGVRCEVCEVSFAQIPGGDADAPSADGICLPPRKLREAGEATRRRVRVEAGEARAVRRRNLPASTRIPGGDADAPILTAAKVRGTECLSPERPPRRQVRSLARCARCDV